MRTTPQVDYDPTSPQVQADPYPYYARLRAHEPVQWNEHVHAWVVSQHSDVVEMLRDPRWSSNYVNPNLDFALSEKLDVQRGGRVLLFMDAADHAQLRRILGKGFDAKRIAVLAAHARAEAAGIIDSFRDRDEVDLISEFAVPLSSSVLARLLGVPASDLSIISECVHDLSGLVDWTPSTRSLEGVGACGAALVPYLLSLIARKRRAPGDDLISALIMQTKDRKMRYVDVISSAILLLAAGHVTSTHMIGNGMLALLSDRHAFEECRSGRYLMVRVVDELLRYDSPVQANPRTALSDIELRGRTIRAGDMGLALLGSANRDDSVFFEPNKINLGRRNAPAVSFGSGPHFCIGAELGRATGAIAFESLLRHYPNLQLADQELKWTPTVTQHGLIALHVALS